MVGEGKSFLKLVEELIRQVEEYRPGLVPASIRQLPEKLTHSQLTLAVLGQFKRGKSTLINALLGAKVLPSSVLPLTSVITVIHFGDTPGLIVHYTNGSEEVREVSELAEFVTEEKNPHNLKGVDWAEVQWPCPFLKRPLQIVDTPGVGSVYIHNNSTAEAFLGHLDAAIFVLGVDPVFTETEREWLIKVREQGEKFFFVLNKVDQLSASEIQQVLDFTEKCLQELWGHSCRLYALSARQGLADPADPAVSSFRHDLEQFLDQEGEKTLFSASRKKVEKTLREVLNLMDLERKAADRPLTELQALLQELNRLEEKLTLERTRAYWVMDEAQTRLLVELGKSFDAFWAQVRDQAQKEVEEGWAQASTIGAGRRNMAAALEAKLEAVFSELREQGEALSESQFATASSYLEDEYTRLLNSLTDESFRQLELKSFSLEIEASEPKRGRFYVDLSPEILGTSGGSVFDFLPRGWGDRWVKRAFLRRLDEFYEMHKARLMTEIADRFQERSAGVVMSLIQTSQQLLSEVKQAVERGVSLKERSQEERDEILRQLSSRQAALQALLSEVSRYH